ncbi:MAG: hypothetical protein KF690_01325 [Bacteroidetes bacterium]|nr:hypothetical protein [Bacteroidota bacterium]
MRLLKNLFIAIALAWGATACIQINEDITLNSDNSGSLSWTMDLKGLLSLMESFGGSAGQTGETSAKMDSTFGDMKAKLMAIPGVSNVKQVSSEADMLFGVTFDFKDVNTLNAALAVVKNSGEAKQKDLLTVSKKKIQRVMISPNMGNNEELANMKDSDIEMAKMFMEGASYNSTLHLSKKARKTSNKYAKLEDGGKTVRMSIPLIDILVARGKLDMNNVVSF